MAELLEVFSTMSQTNGGVNKIPRRKQLLVLNVGTGIEVKLALRMPNNEPEFNSFHEVLDIMLHDLCHNAHGPYNASFYKFYDQFRKVLDGMSYNHKCDVYGFGIFLWEIYCAMPYAGLSFSEVSSAIVARVSYPEFFVSCVACFVILNLLIPYAFGGE